MPFRQLSHLGFEVAHTIPYPLCARSHMPHSSKLPEQHELFDKMKDQACVPAWVELCLLGVTLAQAEAPEGPLLRT